MNPTIDHQDSFEESLIKIPQECEKSIFSKAIEEPHKEKRSVSSQRGHCWSQDNGFLDNQNLLERFVTECTSQPSVQENFIQKRIEIMPKAVEEIADNILLGESKQSLEKSCKVNNFARMKFLRCVKRAAKIGKGLLTLEKEGIKGKILHKDYWLEAVDPYHESAQYRIDGKIIPFIEQVNTWHQSTTTDSFFLWKAKQDLLSQSVYTTQVVYLDPQLRDQYRIFIDGGRLIRKDGFPATTEYGMTSFSGLGAAMFVIGPDKELYMGSQQLGIFHHSSFFQGGSVVAAGEMVINSNGQLIHMTNKSGHYRPEEENTLNALKILYDKGTDLSQTWLTEVSAFGQLSYFPAEAYLKTNGSILPIWVNGLFVKSRWDGLCWLEEGLGIPQPTIEHKALAEKFLLSKGRRIL